MKFRGIITNVAPSLKDGEQRTFEVEDNGVKKTMESFQVTVSVCSNNSDSKVQDTLLLDMVRERVPNSIMPYTNYMNKELLITVAFSVRDWKERKFMSARLINVSEKVE